MIVFYDNITQVVGKLVQLISLSMTLPPLVAMDSTNLSETFGEVREVVAGLLFDSIINSSYNQVSINCDLFNIDFVKSVYNKSLKC